MLLGAHLSGGLARSLDRAREVGAHALQIFTQSPRTWRHPDHAEEQTRAFRERRARSRVGAVVCHATYLINLGATDDGFYAKSVAALTKTYETANAIGADAVVFHLGSHLGRGFEKALDQVVPALEITLGSVPDSSTRLLVENAAGTGGTMGVTIEEIARVIDELGRPPQLGVCLDTCHLFAAGVDITDAGRVDALLDEVDDRLRLERLLCLHVNDSATPLGSSRDRHENVGKGEIGRGLAVMLGHPRLQGLPAIMETAGLDGHGPEARDIRALKRLHKRGLELWAASVAEG